MTTSIRSVLVIVLVSGGAGYACQKTPEQAHDDGVAAQREADKATIEANKRAAEKIAEAKRDVVAAADEARKTAVEAQAKANERIRAANRIVAAERDEMRSWGQNEIYTVDGMIDAAFVKAESGTPKAREQFNIAIASIKQQRDMLNTDLPGLEKRMGDQLEKNKAQFIERVDRIKLALQNLEKAN